MAELPFSSDFMPEVKPARVAKRWIPWWGHVLIAIAVFVTLPPLLLVGFAWLQTIEPQPFDRERWLAPHWRFTGVFHTVRQEMVDDLLATKLKVGMPMNEVHWLIGSPDEKPYYRPGEWTYFLGAERGLIEVDNEWLAIDFDELGRVSRAELATD